MTMRKTLSPVQTLWCPAQHTQESERRESVALPNSGQIDDGAVSTCTMLLRRIYQNQIVFSDPASNLRRGEFCLPVYCDRLTVRQLQDTDQENRAARCRGPLTPGQPGVVRRE